MQRVSTYRRGASVVKKSVVSANGVRHLGTNATMQMTPCDFAKKMKQNGQHRAFIVYDRSTKTMKVSHPMLNDVAEHLKNDKRDYDGHEGIFLAIGPKTGALFSAVVHNTTRGQAQGGLRYWPYNTMEAFLSDGLRLSQGMGRKNALAGLWWGGGKGQIARQNNDDYKDKSFRQTLFNEYGSFTTSLRGNYYTAEDVGLNVEDVSNVFTKTRFATCIPKYLGGSGNPSTYTGHGVVSAMEGALDYLGRGTLEGKKLAVQGLGNVATPMILRALERGVAQVVASDINPVTIAEAHKTFKGKPVEIRQTQPGDNSILFEDADIAAPCALGGILNPETIPKIKAKIICGAANNQLLDPYSDDQELARRGITYIPDFLANRMGIVNCANEMYGTLPNDPAKERHFTRDWENSIFVMTHKILKTAEKDKSTTSVAANKVADQEMAKPHPIWPNRAWQITQSLVKDEWHKRND